MPRKPRLHVPGGAYHVILRGNNREPLFFCRRDRDEWSELLAVSLQRYGCSLHAYCWMTNHVHLLVQVTERPLGQMIQWVASQYARRLNKRKRRTGHLFERRYRALLVDVDEYLISLVKYIHMNPVAAGIVTTPGEFEFSLSASTPPASSGDRCRRTDCYWPNFSNIRRNGSSRIATSGVPVIS